MFTARFIRRTGIALLSAVALWVSSGCATLAHRNSHAYSGKQAVTSCDGGSGPCPWLVGDALLLIPGVVPGVIAFIVDFGSGAWNHDAYAENRSAEDTAVVDAR